MEDSVDDRRDARGSTATCAPPATKRRRRAPGAAAADARRRRRARRRPALQGDLRRAAERRVPGRRRGARELRPLASRRCSQQGAYVGDRDPRRVADRRGARGSSRERGLARGPVRVPDAARRPAGARRRARRATGHRLRVYVPFGTHWYEYSLRRLQENPQIAGYVAADTRSGGSARRAAADGRDAWLSGRAVRSARGCRCGVCRPRCELLRDPRRGTSSPASRASAAACARVIPAVPERQLAANVPSASRASTRPTRSSRSPCGARGRRRDRPRRRIAGLGHGARCRRTPTTPAPPAPGSRKHRTASRADRCRAFCAVCRIVGRLPGSDGCWLRRLAGRRRAAPPRAAGRQTGEREAAVDDQHLPADHLGVGRAEERDRAGDVVGLDEASGRVRLPTASISSRFGKCSSAPVSTTPAETALTRIPRGASSTAR